MTKETLEGAQDPQAEVAEPTQETEEQKLTEPQDKTTVDITKSLEFRKELDKALGKALESTNRQLSLRKKEADQAKSELEEYKTTTASQLDELRAELEDRAREHEEALKAVDDDSVRKSYSDRVSLSKREREAKRREAAAEERFKKAELMVFKTGLEKFVESKVKDLKAKGFDTTDLVKELEDCNLEDEMEIAALRYELTHKPAETKAETQEEEEEKFDSGRGGGRGANLAGLSTEDRLARALTKMDKGK